MARNTKEEAEETRNRILDAAEDVFYRQGVARTSLAEIAHAAEVTRGAIYWHFKNKSDLFDAMCERVCLPLEAMIEPRTEEERADPLGRLRNQFIFILTETANNPHSRKVIDIMLHKCEFIDASDAIYIRQKECYQKGVVDIERSLQDAIDRGQLPQDLDVVVAGISVHAVLAGLLNNWLFVPENFNLAEKAAQLINASFEMLRYAPSLRKS